MRLSKKNKGTTLVEVLISVSIIGIISTFYLAGYSSFNERANVRLAAHKMASDIRMSQNNALSLREFNGAPPSGGWGVFFNTGAPNQYIIFADVDEDRNYDSPGERDRIISLPAGVSITGVTYKDGVPSQNDNHIVFLPPDPKTFLNDTNNGSITITLNGSWQVEINFLGLIDVKQN